MNRRIRFLVALSIPQAADRGAMLQDSLILRSMATCLIYRNHCGSEAISISINLSNARRYGTHQDRQAIAVPICLASRKDRLLWSTADYVKTGFGPYAKYKMIFRAFVVRFFGSLVRRGRRYASRQCGNCLVATHNSNATRDLRAVEAGSRSVLKQTHGSGDTNKEVPMLG
jgi:hypothetical protein